MKRFSLLLVVLLLVAGAAIGGWMAGSKIISPAEAAARTAPPTPSPILVPVEERTLSSTIVTRGTVRFGLPQPVSLAPSALKAGPGLITTLPLRNTQFAEGQVLLTESGRPVFVLQGAVPAYRDLTPGISGKDVQQLEEALKRLGFDPGPTDGTYDEQTSAAVAKWYEAVGYEPFGPTPQQLLVVQTLEKELADANRSKLASAIVVADLAVEVAHATAEHKAKLAASDIAAKAAARDALVIKGDNLALEAAHATAAQAKRQAAADIATKIADRSMIALDPRATTTQRSAAEAQVEVARASSLVADLQGELAVKQAEREAKFAAEQLVRAEAAVKTAQEEGDAAIKAAKLEGDLVIQTALNAQKVAELDAAIATERSARLTEELNLAKSKLGVQVPLDEIVFLPALPVRVELVSAIVGNPASGPLLTVTDNQLTIDSSLALDAAPLVKAGMPVNIDEQSLGIEAQGAVARVETTPGTFGVDGFHIYFEVKVDETPKPLEGFSVRLTIPIESTAGDVIAVPASALSLAADGTSRVHVDLDGKLDYITVEPGLAADGYVEVTPVKGELKPGQMVVVGYETSDAAAHVAAQ